MLNILKFFENIDNYIFYNKGPNWLLHKNNTTIYLNYIIEDKKEMLYISYIFPYEFYYFFFSIIYIFIYIKILLYNLVLNQIYMIGTTYDKRVIMNLIIMKVLWKISYTFIIWWELLKSSLTNINNPGGLLYFHIMNIYLYSFKYNKLDNIIDYKNLYNLYNYNLYNYINYKDFILINKINNWIIIYKFLIIFNIYWYIIQIIIKYYWKNYIFKLLYIKENINIIIRNNNNKLKSIYQHYKFKKTIWNSYFFK
jgi:hypothetical protein